MVKIEKKNDNLEATWITLSQTVICSWKNDFYQMSLFNQITLYDISTKLQAQKQAHGECFFFTTIE